MRKKQTKNKYKTGYCSAAANKNRALKNQQEYQETYTRKLEEIQRRNEEEGTNRMPFDMEMEATLLADEICGRDR